jgi:hypothetical protein
MAILTAQDGGETPEVTRLRWARELFDLPDDASPRQVRDALLGHVQDMSFFPAASHRQAIRVLSDPPGRRAADQGFDSLQAATETRLRDEVERFIGRFFDLTPHRRREQWEELLERCDPFPRLRCRLGLLESGLDVEVKGLAPSDGPLRILIERVAATFLLRPGPREAQRQQYLQSMQLNATWTKAARKLRSGFPRVSQLDEELVVALANPKAPAPQPVKGATKATNRKVAYSSTGKSGRSVSGWAITVIVIGIVRAIASFDHSGPTPPNTWQYNSNRPRQATPVYRPAPSHPYYPPRSNPGPVYPPDPDDDLPAPPRKSNSNRVPAPNLAPQNPFPGPQSTPMGSRR